MMGSTDDPKDGSAVAATVFVAVAVYGVYLPLQFLLPPNLELICDGIGIPHFLRKPSIPTHPRVETGSHCIVIKYRRM
jgi:hypothetical protein